MESTRKVLFSLLALLLIIQPIQADWWDDFTDSVSNGIRGAGDWVKDTASPVIRTKFNEYKEKLQDPETHKNIREWIKEKADNAAEFAQAEIVPELKKIYEAATADTDATTTEKTIDDELNK